VIRLRIGRRVHRGARRLQALEGEFQLLDLALELLRTRPEPLLFSRAMVIFSASTRSS
jgi:hypothetical protein